MFRFVGARIDCSDKQRLVPSFFQNLSIYKTWDLDDLITTRKASGSAVIGYDEAISTMMII